MRSEGEGHNELEDILQEKLQQHISNIRHLENGNLYNMVINMVEEPLIRLVLQETGGNQVKAAAILGINRNTLRKKIVDRKINT
ncbi:MAG: helix-turn-helix domain-containing protein [Nitrospinota bacterium]|nr:Fis family transcriptional regulator [Nitrospinota bacterium]